MAPTIVKKEEERGKGSALVERKCMAEWGVGIHKGGGGAFRKVIDTIEHKEEV